MKVGKLAWYAALAAAIVFLGFAAAPARAEDEDGDGYDDIYVAPLDEDGSDEALREGAGSGFDTAGPVTIGEDDYDAGDQGDGTWEADVPDASEPEPVDEGE